jgi:hypothetical protein
MFVRAALGQPFVVHQRRKGHLMICECIDELGGRVGEELGVKPACIAQAMYRVIEEGDR